MTWTYVGGEVLEKIEIIMRCIDDDQTQDTVIAAFEKSRSSQTDPETMIFPGLVIFLNQQQVYKNGKLISLTSREFHTLVYLAQHPEWVCSADSIYENVWQESSERRGTAVENVICQLRHKLTPDAPRDGYIRTVIGDGYKFVIPKQTDTAPE